MNCWEIMECGREIGGKKVVELGICPASAQSAGDSCWLVAGTFCGGEVQGTTAEKEGNCLRCSFYKQFDLVHKGKMRKKHGKG